MPSLSSKPSFYTDWINWAFHTIAQFGSHGDLPKLELFARSVLAVFRVYEGGVPTRYWLDPLKPLRTAMRDVRTKWGG